MYRKENSLIPYPTQPITLNLYLTFLNKMFSAVNTMINSELKTS